MKNRRDMTNFCFFFFLLFLSVYEVWHVFSFTNRTSAFERSSKEIFVDEKVFFKVAINFFVYLSPAPLIIGLILAVFAKTL